jgi:flagellin-like hook-associated protein FlgL
LRQALKKLKNSRRLTDLSMTKKEIDALLSEVKSIANEAERQTKKRLTLSKEA